MQETVKSERIKRQAADKVLTSLSGEMADILKHQFKRTYDISFDPEDDSKFSLDQLHFALSVLLGEVHANSILEQITNEIKELTRAQAQ